jgi:predicted small integral membrane protein
MSQSIRCCKLLLALGVGLLLALVAVNNVFDYNSNLKFVQHILAMDTIDPANPLHWRAIRNVPAQHVFYVLLILWEFSAAGAVILGAVHSAKCIRADGQTFHRSKNGIVIGLTLSMLIWLVAFLTVGGEWFLMWQSPTWNGQAAALRMFLLSGVVMIVVLLPDP